MDAKLNTFNKKCTENKESDKASACLNIVSHVIVHFSHTHEQAVLVRLSWGVVVEGGDDAEGTMPSGEHSPPGEG